MTLKQILYLQMIQQTGSISQAAKELYIAQSSLSASIREIEQEYRIQLFERSNKGVSLTRQGQEFLNDLQYISDYYKNIEKKYKGYRAPRQSFGVSKHHHVPGIDAFRKLTDRLSDASEYSLSYLEGGTNFIIENVERGISDIGIVFCTQSGCHILYQEVNNRNLAFHHMRYSKLHMYVHNTHPLANEQGVTLSQMTNSPFLSYDEQDPASRRFTNTLHQWNLARRIIQVTDRASTYNMLQSLNAYFTGSGYLSDEEKHMGLRAIPIIDQEEVEIGWIQRNDRVLSELAMEFIALLTQTES